MQDFLDRKARRSPSTAKTYAGALRLWTKSLSVNSPEEGIRLVKNGSLDSYKVLDDFIGYLHKLGRAPKTITTYFGAVKHYMIYNDIEINDEKLRNKTELPQRYDVSVDRAPTIEELRRILMHGTLECKAMITTLCSSGMRSGELVCLKIGHIDFNARPTTIILPASITKTRKSRIVFASDEATELLKEYLGKRLGVDDKDSYIFPRHARENDKVVLRYDMHVSKSNIYSIIQRTLKRAGLYMKMDEDSRRYALHPHTFRKFFFTRMMRAGVDRGIVERLVGHKFGLDASYLKLTEEELAGIYLQAMPHLTILTAEPDKEKIAEQIARSQVDLLEGLFAPILSKYTKPLLPDYKTLPSEKKLEVLRNHVKGALAMENPVESDIKLQNDGSANNNALKQRVLSIDEAEILINEGKARFLSNIGSKAVVEVLS